MQIFSLQYIGMSYFFFLTAFELVTAASAVGCASSEPPHILKNMRKWEEAKIPLKNK